MDLVDITLWLEFVLFVLLMGLSGFFSSSETSLFSLNKTQLEQMRRDENPRVSLIERLLSEPRRLIVTILIGNEFVNVAASVISAAIIIRLYGADNKFFNLFIMIPILLLVGEITPKTLAIRNNIAFATFQSQPIELFSRFIAPLRWIVRQVAEWFTTLIVGKELARGSIVTKDMVRTLAKEAVGDGVLDHDEAQYIEQIFDFGNRTVGEIMTPRSHVFFLPIDMPLEELIEALRRTRHTRVPLYQQHRDQVVGMLHVRDLLGMDLEVLKREPERLKKLLREPYFVPETKPASDLFRAFRKRKRSVALVVDEYGGVTGLASMEDLLECIFGDIPSPSERPEAMELEVLADGTTQIDGAMSIEQFNRELGGTLEEGPFETVGGLMLHRLGELPEEGAGILLGEMEFTVVQVRDNRIKTLAVRKATAAPVEKEAPKVPSEASERPEKPAQQEARD